MERLERRERTVNVEHAYNYTEQVNDLFFYSFLYRACVTFNGFGESARDFSYGIEGKEMYTTSMKEKQEGFYDFCFQ